MAARESETDNERVQRWYFFSVLSLSTGEKEKRKRETVQRSERKASRRTIQSASTWRMSSELCIVSITTYYCHTVSSGLTRPSSSLTTVLFYSCLSFLNVWRSSRINIIICHPACLRQGADSDGRCCWQVQAIANKPDYLLFRNKKSYNTVVYWRRTSISCFGETYLSPSHTSFL